jgi:hypothetical protein
MNKKLKSTKLTLNPLSYEQAVSAFLKVKPEPKQLKRKKNEKILEIVPKPSGTQPRIPSGEAASGSDGLFEAVVLYHQTSPSSFPGKGNDKQHVIAINKRL